MRNRGIEVHSYFKMTESEAMNFVREHKPLRLRESFCLTLLTSDKHVLTGKDEAFG